MQVDNPAGGQTIAIATRYGKTARNFLAASTIWLI
jgi:hypothetical protein